MNANFNDSLIQALDECLELIEKGASKDQVLLRYPSKAAELRPMLEAAEAALNLVDNIQVPTGAQSQSRAAFLNAAQVYQKHGPSSESKTYPSRPQQKSFIRSLAQAVFIVLVFFAIGSATVAGVSARSLPGDVLYPVKLVTEQTQLLFTRAPQERIKLDQSFNEERIEEIKTLTTTHSGPTKVDFAGKIEPSEESGWHVGGLKLIIEQEAEVEEFLNSGLYLDISGELLSDGTVQVNELRPREYNMKGKIENLAPAEWVVSGILVKLTSDTTVKGTPGIGLDVDIKGYLSADGSLQAKEIRVKNQKGGGKNQEAPPQPTQEAGETVEPARTQQPNRNRNDSEGPNKTDEPEETHKPQATEIDEDPEETPEATETPKPGNDD